MLPTVNQMLYWEIKVEWQRVYELKNIQQLECFDISI